MIPVSATYTLKKLPSSPEYAESGAVVSLTIPSLLTMQIAVRSVLYYT
jgi:hypothetical protein